MKRILKSVLLGLLTVFATQIQAQDGSKFFRWTNQDDQDGSFAKVLQVLNQKAGLSLSAQDFRLDEDRDLAYDHYQRYTQLVDKLPVQSMAIRLWVEKGSTRLLQAEANVVAPSSVKTGKDFIHLQRARQMQAAGDFNGLAQLSVLTTEEAQKLVLAAVRASEDSKMRDIKSSRMWIGQDLVDQYTIRAAHGTHVIQVGVVAKKILNQTYTPYATGDQQLTVNLYPIYEEFNETLLPREPKTLSYISELVPRYSEDPYADLRSKSYLLSKLDPFQAETAAGQAAGFWSFPRLFQDARMAVSRVPLMPNNFEFNGVWLRGRYATTNIHPNAFEKFKGIEIPQLYSTNFFPRWVEREDGDTDIIPSSGFLGKVVLSPEEAMNRPATRLPEHDPVRYINEGFDEMQVYYAINELFTELKARGFTDPELSTRPFHALLFDPDISMRDNAYYTNDTINFTTYSAHQVNMARDNTTIWHELGHGVMDRLMGDFLQLADTGGLQEGMADFVAQLVIEGANQGKPFLGQEHMRVVNSTGFYLTNEVHDDGEAYGGSMRDMLESSMKTFGHEDGLLAFTDLTLEAMRFSRDHPHLTASDWFDHMLFADSVGSPLRKPNLLHDVVVNALSHRNFVANPAARATMSLTYEDKEITSDAAGSRSKPIPLTMKADETKAFNLKVKLKSGDGLKFQYPLNVKVFYVSGPLQGAIKWENQDHEPQIVTLQSEADVATIPMKVYGKCDYANREDGSCVDFAYVQIWNGADAKKPVAKKRFYLRIKTQG